MFLALFENGEGGSLMGGGHPSKSTKFDKSFLFRTLGRKYGVRTTCIPNAAVCTVSANPPNFYL